MSDTSTKQNAFVAMSKRPPIPCVFHYKGKAVMTHLKMPLVQHEAELETLRSLIHCDSDNAVFGLEHYGTRMMDLEIWLRERFNIPMSLSAFGVVPWEELYSPPFPFSLINTLVLRLRKSSSAEGSTKLQFALIVKDISVVHQSLPLNAADSPYNAISAALLQAKDHQGRITRECLANNLERYGFARIKVSDAEADLAQKAFVATKKWLMKQQTLSLQDRWYEQVDATSPQLIQETEGSDRTASSAKRTLVSRGRFVGHASDRSRQYLQLRHPMMQRGTKWPPIYFRNNDDDKEYAALLLSLLRMLDSLARNCLLAICNSLHMDSEYIMKELLDDLSTLSFPLEGIADRSYQYGASVLRIYNYNSQQTSQESQPSKTQDDACSLHADLGILTLSPAATTPGLQIWMLTRMMWTDVENDAKKNHFTVFAGETLGYLTQGRITAPLHRVPKVNEERMSMPYFLRARPDKILNPHDDPRQQLSCRDFMEDVIFKKRPWRRQRETNPRPLDY